jgi:hypothetical protein
VGFLIKNEETSTSKETKTYEVVKSLSDNINNTGGAVYLVKEQGEAKSSAVHPEIETKSASHNSTHMISGASK